jgi:NCAIR mutase (PurE)-related protein
MYQNHIYSILEKVQSGKLSVEHALKALTDLPYEDVGFANIDHHRALRKGFPEVIFCQNKTPAQVAEIMKRLVKHNQGVLATRASEDIFQVVRESVPQAEYHEMARSITVGRDKNGDRVKTDKQILLISAGTADISVAEEAGVTAEMMSQKVERLYDVGVAGIHRLLNNKEKLDSANVLIVVAGMDGVLPSVVGGLVAKPVVAVPTSVGYGASFEGVAPLLTMLNACSPGVVVVNIDNGFGAGYFASLINR